MAESDRLILESLDTRKATEIGELVSLCTPFSEPYIRSRLAKLATYGLVHYNNGDEMVNLTQTGKQYRDDPDFGSESELSMEIGYCVPKVSVSYPPVPWLTSSELRTLNEIENAGGETSIEKLTNHREKIKKVAEAEKLAKLGILSKKNMTGYTISEKGTRMISGEITQSEALKNNLPTRVNIIHTIGEKLLSLFGKFDPSEDQVLPDIQSATYQINPVFLDQFRQRIRIYKFIPVIIFVFWLIISISGSIMANLQTYGLLLDVIGASLVAIGLFRGITGFAVDVEENVGRLGGDGKRPLRPAQLASATTDTVDGFFGVVFLIVGFSLQIISTLTFNI